VFLGWGWRVGCIVYVMTDYLGRKGTRFRKGHITGSWIPNFLTTGICSEVKCFRGLIQHILLYYCVIILLYYVILFIYLFIYYYYYYHYHHLYFLGLNGVT